MFSECVDKIILSWMLLDIRLVIEHLNRNKTHFLPQQTKKNSFPKDTISTELGRE